MRLRIEVAGQLERIIVTSLPSRFIARIFRHCLGKNNTPYFANNCFKGVLYFDYEFAIQFAESVDFAWTNWQEVTPIFQAAGYGFEQYLDIVAKPEEGSAIPLTTSDLETEVRVLELVKALELVKQDEICIVLGAVDKGGEAWEIDVDGHFDPTRLLISLDSLESFKMQEMLITGISYDGQAMTRIPGKHIGKNMVTPVMFSPDGRELDLQDFMGQKLEL